MPENVDVHDFEPTPSEVQQVATAEILIYSGAGLEPWIPQIGAADNPKLVTVDSSQGINSCSLSLLSSRKKIGLSIHTYGSLPVLAKQQVNNILQGLIKADPDRSTVLHRKMRRLTRRN